MNDNTKGAAAAKNTRLDIMSLIRAQCHRVYASAIDREEIDSKYMAEIEDALRVLATAAPQAPSATDAKHPAIRSGKCVLRGSEGFPLCGDICSKLGYCNGVRSGGIASPDSASDNGMASFPERDLSKPAEQQGVFRKFDVRRVDGSDQPGGKHFGCRYFVLDLNHDQHAPAAMRAYAAACRATHPQLADDIEAEFPTPAAAQGVDTAPLDDDQCLTDLMLAWADAKVGECAIAAYDNVMLHIATTYGAQQREAGRRERDTEVHRMVRDFPALQAFHLKHALGPMLPPSCLCCGQQTHLISRPVAIKHGELPGIVICESCRDAALSRQPAGEGLTQVLRDIVSDGYLSETQLARARTILSAPVAAVAQGEPVAYMTADYRTLVFADVIKSEPCYGDAKGMIPLYPPPVAALAAPLVTPDADGSACNQCGTTGPHLCEKSAAAQGDAVRELDGVEIAALYIDKKAETYLNEHADNEPDTGAIVWHYGRAGREYHDTLVELAEELRALRATHNEGE